MVKTGRNSFRFHFISAIVWPDGHPKNPETALLKADVSSDKKVTQNKPELAPPVA